MIQVKSLVIHKSGKWILGEIDPYFAINSVCVLYSVIVKEKITLFSDVMIKL